MTKSYKILLCICFCASSLAAQTNTTCTADGNCNTHSVCREDRCECLYGFYTFEPQDPNDYCNYKQKSRTKALMLNSFSGGLNGNAEWYMEEDPIAWTRFGLTGGGLGFSIFFRVYEVTKKNSKEKAISLSTLVTVTAINLGFALTNQIFGLVDNIRYRDMETDGNGVPTIE